jgi:predicted HD phosphohydrolase
MIPLEKIYDDIREEFPNSPRPELRYVNRHWIFPQHIDVMLDICDELLTDHEGDEYVCKAAIILHDVGLVYNRDQAAPTGHENRSVAYAKDYLDEKVPSDLITKITNCIKATDERPDDPSLNQRIVRTCDGHAKYKSIHYLAKAQFSAHFKPYTEWLKAKIDSDYEKIEFDAHREQIQPVRKWLQDIIEDYEERRSPHRTTARTIRSKAEDERIEDAMSYLIDTFNDSGANPKPVILHSTRVAMTLYDEGYDTDVIVGALLHDLIEDTRVEESDISKRFGEHVASLVTSVSFHDTIQDYEERYKELFKRCEAFGSEALLIKTADILDNSTYYESEKHLRKIEYFLDVATPTLRGHPVFYDLQRKTEKVEQRIRG